MSTIEIQSQTNPSTVYAVSIDGNDAVACTCPSRVYRPGKPCKHMQAAAAAGAAAFDAVADAAAYRAGMAEERRLMLRCLWAGLPWAS